MDRFIDKIKEDSWRDTGDLDHRRPLDLYRARNATRRQWRTAGHGDHPFPAHPAFLCGDSSHRLSTSIDLSGFRVRNVPGRLITQSDLPLRDMLDRYELHIYKQWLRVYMRSKMIKHNKDLFECLDDPLALLDRCISISAVWLTRDRQ